MAGDDQPTAYPTAEKVRQQILLERAATGAPDPFLQRVDGKVVKPGLEVLDAAGGRIVLTYRGLTGQPRKIPVEVLTLLDRALVPFLPGAAAGLLHGDRPTTAEYGRSSETLRRAQTMRSILDTWLTDQQARIAKLSGIPNETLAQLRQDAPQYAHIECVGGDFPRNPTRADLDLLRADTPERLPLLITAVRVKPSPPTRTIILAEYDVAGIRKRPDLVIISGEVSQVELDALKTKPWTKLDPAVRRMRNIRMHVGDINRLLRGVGRANHFVKTTDYLVTVVKSVAGDLLSMIKLTLDGRITLSCKDVLLDTAGGVLDASGFRAARTSPEAAGKATVLHLEAELDLSSVPSKNPDGSPGAVDVDVRIRTNVARSSKRRTEAQLAKLLGADAVAAIKRLRQSVQQLRASKPKQP